MENRFKKAIQAKKEFIYTLELVPGRGAHGKTQDDVLRMAGEVARSGLVHAVSLTDNPGGHPALSPEVIGSEIARLGVEPIIHFTCKDKNRNQMESILSSLDRIGLSNLLCMTGDFPLYGFEGHAKPVFDLDSTQLLNLIGHMNQGLDIDGKAPGGGVRLPPTQFVKGCTVSPFKKYESEVFAQYYKLHRKVALGADFAVTQVGFDARKFDELRRYMRLQDIRVPIFGNVYVPNRAVAGMMNRNAVPGCVVTDKLYQLYEEEAKAPDKGKAARLLRAAKLVAILHGLGYDGVHIGGPNLVYGDIEWIIGQGKQLAARWEELVPEFSFPQKNGFYLFTKDEKTGLNRDILANNSRRPRKVISHAIMRFFHHFVFTPGAPLYKPSRRFFEKIDGTALADPVTEFEYGVKFITSRCRRCGDCTLPEMAFLCPQSQCPKYLFNGQCSGSYEGWCEVFPGKKKCIYVRAYDRLRAHGEEESLREGYTAPRNWALDQTSSWANYFLKRDHHALTQIKRDK